MMQASHFSNKFLMKWLTDLHQVLARGTNVVEALDLMLKLLM
jgi:hypothetical protein